MSSTTTRLGLKRADGSDPFLRQDFVDNLNLLDDNPGVFVCTSGTRPSWGASQAGRQIIETDTKRQLLWDGSSFVQIRNAGNGWFSAGLINLGIPSGTSITPTIGSFTTTTPGSVQITAAIDFHWENSTTAGYFTASLMIDGTRIDGNITPKVSGLAFGAGSTNFDDRQMTVQGMGKVAAGTHTITTQITVGVASAVVKVDYYSVIAHMVNSTLDGSV